MADFDINILGCGSALPTTRHLATSQIVDLRDKLYMIDCGEGTQVQMRRMRIKFSRLNHILILSAISSGVTYLILVFSMTTTRSS